MKSQPTKKVSLLIPCYSSNSASVFGYYFGTPYDDENIDITTTIYISSVRERFRVKRINFGRKS